MNAKLNYECQGCQRRYEKEGDAASCCPPEYVWVCKCGNAYGNQDKAEECCSLEYVENDPMLTAALE